MIAVVQRAARARVLVEGAVMGEIGHGLVVLLGVADGDDSKDARFIAGKLERLRIFNDDDRLMNLSIGDAGGELLVISQFTLLGDARKGNRPSFIRAARPAQAEALYEEVVGELRQAGLNVETGEFGAMMKVELVNDGPVTLIVESPEKK
ncbi:MAG: D-aminoacyl-tRNA deacylase [Thermoleophilia bacterium]